MGLVPYPSSRSCPYRFINARRRILQPMLDASNPDPAPKAKKMKSQHRPTQRFWPDSIVAGVLQTHRSQTGNNSESRPTVKFPNTHKHTPVYFSRSQKREMSSEELCRFESQPLDGTVAPFFVYVRLYSKSNGIRLQYMSHRKHKLSLSLFLEL